MVDRFAVAADARHRHPASALHVGRAPLLEEEAENGMHAHLVAGHSELVIGRAALSGDKKIVVCTIQTFPALIQNMQELTATSGKRFAVIADEAHSSQTGDAALKLRKVLSAAELAELADGGEVSIDDLLAADMSTRASGTRAVGTGITYVAFTATPKAKTLELFGRRPNPKEPAGPGNLPAPFHVYSMRQAIEEGFILDVLQNYTSYKLAFQLAQESQQLSSEEVERSAALKKLMGWVKLHPWPSGRPLAGSAPEIGPPHSV